MSQKELAREFANGGRHGRASNVRIHDVAGGYTLLVGYGHAVYAARASDGYIVAYRDWHGYSPTTSSQMTKMGVSHPEDTSVPEEHYRERCIVDHWIERKARLREWEPKGLRT